MLPGKISSPATPIGLPGAGAGVVRRVRRRVRRGGRLGAALGRGRHQAPRVLPAVRGRDAAAPVVVAVLPPRARRARPARPRAIAARAARTGPTVQC